MVSGHRKKEFPLILMKSGSDKEVCGMYMLQVKDGAIKFFVQVSLRSDRIMAVDML